MKTICIRCNNKIEDEKEYKSTKKQRDDIKKFKRMFKLLNKYFYNNRLILKEILIVNEDRYNGAYYPRLKTIALSLDWVNIAIFIHELSHLVNHQHYKFDDKDFCNHCYRLESHGYWFYQTFIEVKERLLCVEEQLMKNGTKL